ncbi:MAG: transporter substrate-binding domain-containing protein [Desulfovibrionaceae bacterium]|nr:transporter substrate-binding domain-containing protein [Desulfovibrionaceae bacterium]
MLRYCYKLYQINKPVVLVILLFCAFSALAVLGLFSIYGNKSDLSKNPYVFYNKNLTARIGAYAPYAFMDKGGTLDGYVMDLTYAISRVMGVRIVLTSRRLDSPQEIAQQQDADVVLCMVQTPANREEYNFTQPYATHSFSVFARKDSPLPEGNSLASNETWCVNKDGVYYDLHRSEIEKSLCNISGTAEEALYNIEQGKYTYAIMETYIGNKIIEEQSLSNVVQLKETNFTVEYAFAIKKGNIEALQIFKEGLSYLQSSGQFEKIQNKWLEKRFIMTEKMFHSLKIYFFAALFFLVFAVFIAIVWSALLKKQVKMRTLALEQEVTERKKTEECLLQSQAQLVQADKMAAIGTLASGVAHEINNPNGLLLLNLDFLRHAMHDIRPLLEEKFASEGDFLLGGMPWSRLRATLDQLLDDTVSASERIRTIVDDLREFVRKDVLEKNHLFDINTSVETALRLVHAIIKKSTDCCNVTLAQNLPPIQGSSQKIEQVVINLLINACQALENKQQKIHVETALSPDGTCVLFSVHDTGRGVPAENISSLCDPFFTTKREHGGTGLGLSISDTIVKNHGGTMTFISAQGKGTSVLVSLPCTGKALPEGAKP